MNEWDILYYFFKTDGLKRDFINGWIIFNKWIEIDGWMDGIIFIFKNNNHGSH